MSRSKKTPPSAKTIWRYLKGYPQLRVGIYRHDLLDLDRLPELYQETTEAIKNTKAYHVAYIAHEQLASEKNIMDLLLKEAISEVEKITQWPTSIDSNVRKSVAWLHQLIDGEYCRYDILRPRLEALDEYQQQINEIEATPEKTKAMKESYHLVYATIRAMGIEDPESIRAVGREKNREIGLLVDDEGVINPGVWKAYLVPTMRRVQKRLQYR
ncbi:MAG: hypothetical protein GXP63_05685 [DPANN group archaeon]|nr:hypothetical protein [DPANN group archaeon]